MSSGYTYIRAKQIQWALNNGIPLTGSAGVHGEKAYTHTLEQNLFEPLLDENRAAFSGANGQELAGTPENPAKMQALHSSSALGVNIFQYWQKRGLLDEIAAACGFCNKGSKVTRHLVFEDRSFSLGGYLKTPPNIDVVIHNQESARYQCFAVECKFSEAYGGRSHGAMKAAYLAEERIWEGLPALHALAEKLCSDEQYYGYLDAAQLIRHILGLSNKLGKAKFRLLYLWYDVLGKEGGDHRAEVEDFASIAKAEGVHFHALTYQELILKLAREYRDQHPAYIEYLTSRYL